MVAPGEGRGTALASGRQGDLASGPQGEQGEALRPPARFDAPGSEAALHPEAAPVAPADAKAWTAGAAGESGGDGGGPPTGSGPELDSPGLAASISRVLEGGKGDYSVLLSLHPPELGQVQARLSLRGDVLQVDLSPEHAAAHDALESALPSLRQHLAQDGVEVDVTLGDPGARPQGAPAEDSGREVPRAGRLVPDPSDGSSPAPGAPASSWSEDPDRLHLVL